MKEIKVKVPMYNGPQYHHLQNSLGYSFAGLFTVVDCHQMCTIQLFLKDMLLLCFRKNEWSQLHGFDLVN